MTKGKWCVAVDGEAGKFYDGIGKNGLQFSPIVGISPTQYGGEQIGAWCWMEKSFQCMKASWGDTRFSARTTDTLYMAHSMEIGVGWSLMQTLDLHRGACLQTSMKGKSSHSMRFTSLPGDDGRQHLFGSPAVQSDAILRFVNGPLDGIGVLTGFVTVGGMARKLRGQYPGAIQHVMNRGDRREMAVGLLACQQASIRACKRGLFVRCLSHEPDCETIRRAARPVLRDPAP